MDRGRWPALVADGCSVDRHFLDAHHPQIGDEPLRPGFLPVALLKPLLIRKRRLVMFTNKKHVGSVRADKYVTVIDWQSVGGAVVIAVIVLAVIGSCSS